MKNISKAAILILIFVLASCKDKPKNSYQEISTESLNDGVNVKAEKVPPTAFSSTVDSIVDDYLKIKNALVNNDSKEAAAAAKVLLKTFNGVNTDSIDPKLKNQYTAIADEAKDHMENIGNNPEKVDLQRIHFSKLSGDINNLIMIFGTNKKLYQDYCPMYNEGAAGFWISEMKGIKNPYYGPEMLTCGVIKKEF